VRSTFASDAPEAASTALRFCMTWWVCSWMPPTTTAVYLGSSGIWPDVKSRFPALTACEYGPIAAGAESDSTIDRLAFMISWSPMRWLDCVILSRRPPDYAPSEANGRIARSKHRPLTHILAAIKAAWRPLAVYRPAPPIANCLLTPEPVRSNHEGAPGMKRHWDLKGSRSYVWAIRGEAARICARHSRADRQSNSSNV